MKSHFSSDFVLAPFQLKNIAVVNSSAKNGQADGMSNMRIDPSTGFIVQKVHI